MKKALTILIFAILVQGCKDTNEENITQVTEYKSDKQIRMQLSPNLWLGSDSDISDVYGIWQAIIKFNIDNYAGVDSVTLVSIMRTSEEGVSCVNGLYNLTDSSYISKSEIKTKSKVGVVVESRNIISELPKREITIVPYIRSEKKGVSVEVQNMYLMLYRK